MQIIDILTRSRVAIDVPAASKKSALEELARLVAADRPELTPAQAFDALIDRERLGSTGFGNGIALPHGRIRHLNRMVGAFLRAQTPVDFDAIDGQPVDLFFALFVPEDTTQEHLTMLSNLAELFSDENLVRKLRESVSTQTIFGLFSKHAERLP